MIKSQYGTVIRDRKHLGNGTTWVGSWHNIEAFYIQGFHARIEGTYGHGSLVIIGGVAGTRASHMVGTVYGPVDIPVGSLQSWEADSTVKYFKPRLKCRGDKSGTVSFGFSGYHL